MTPFPSRRADASGEIVPSATVLSVTGLSKSFPGVRALANVDLDVRTGEVHALVGENGAGKSTLIKLLAGVYQPDSGSIEVDGAAARIGSTRQASELGLAFIHQDLNFVPNFSGVENMTLGSSLPCRGGVLVRWRELKRRTRAVADRMGVDFDLSRPVKDLSQAQRVVLAICRALMSESRVIVMDEPTAALSGAEVERLYHLVRELTRHGVAVLYVSHRLEEVFDLAHRVTVLKDGEKVGTYNIGDIADTSQLTRLIIGRPLEALLGTHKPIIGGAALTATNVTWGNSVRDVSLTLHSGEIVGLAGLVGSGRSELAHVLFGAARPDSGEIAVGGHPVHLKSPRGAIKHGIALIPEDRRNQAGVMRMKVRENATLASLRRYRVGPFVARGRERTAVRQIVDRFAIKTASLESPLRELSGGNQQKVVIGKWVDSEASVYLFDEPTQGVDIGAKQEIYSIMRDLADEGAAILFISSDLDELVGIADRLLVMREGSIVAHLGRPEATVAAVLHHCYSTTAN